MSDKNLYDLIIIGAGPAGLGAAIYAGRARLKALIIDKSDIGGQIKITNEVVNYPGVLSTSGAALAATMAQQARQFGTEFVTEEIAEVDFSGNIKTIKTKSGKIFSSIAVIIATGAKPRKLGFKGEEEFSGRGVAYCATCDGEFFTGKDVFVIGAGFAAAEEAIFLTRFAKKVTIIAREPEFTCSKTIADAVMANEKIEVKFNSEIIHVKGTTTIKEAKFIDNITKETWEYVITEGIFGVFVFIGYQPESELFINHVEFDKYGYIPTSEDMETNVPGVYAAGDIRPKRLRQLVTAAADGAIASTAAEKYVTETKKTHGYVVIPPVSLKADKKDLLDDKVTEQIQYVMNRCERKINIVAILKDNDKLSSDVKAFLDEFSKASDKMPIEIYKPGENTDAESRIGTTLFPVIALFDGKKYLGVSFIGVPGGHELESFILAVYNAAGPGQPIDDSMVQRIKNLPRMNMIIGISQTCTMCPELVQSAQRIALINGRIKAHMVDLNQFPEMAKKFEILSIPALIINENDVHFGRKNLEELVSHLE